MGDWTSPVGLMAALSLASVMISIGYNYRSLAAMKEEQERQRDKIEKLEGHQERIAVLEVKLDNALQALEKITRILEARRDS